MRRPQSIPADWDALGASFRFRPKEVIKTRQSAAPAFRFTDEEMEIAKGTDLPDLLEHLGYSARRVGSRYHTTREMDSLMIKDRRRWKRYSSGRGGDAITFLQEFCGKDFQEAVYYLLEFNGKRARDSPTPRPRPAQKEEKPAFTLPIAHTDSMLTASFLFHSFHNHCNHYRSACSRRSGRAGENGAGTAPPPGWAVPRCPAGQSAWAFLGN